MRQRHTVSPRSDVQDLRTGPRDSWQCASTAPQQWEAGSTASARLLAALQAATASQSAPVPAPISSQHSQASHIKSNSPSGPSTAMLGSRNGRGEVTSSTMLRSQRTPPTSSLASCLSAPFPICRCNQIIAAEDCPRHTCSHNKRHVRSIKVAWRRWKKPGRGVFLWDRGGDSVGNLLPHVLALVCTSHCFFCFCCCVACDVSLWHTRLSTPTHKRSR